MTPDWTPLQQEFDLWEKQDLRLPFWWRDDDAVTVTPQLEQLVDLSAQSSVPVHLAIIPKDADESLAAYLPQTRLIPVVHGWAHANHAPASEKKSEFRLHRPMQEMIADAQTGMTRLQDLFGGQLRPMFVPPWNRIASEIAQELPGLGFRVLSTATPRKSRFAAPGLERVNTHLDPIDWRGTRGLVSPDKLIMQATALLRDRREGQADNAEPFGLLTHHLVHDDDIWTFTRELLHRFLTGPVSLWTAPKD